jgi:hypothetical protein
MSDIECLPSGAAGPVAERDPLSAGSVWVAGFIAAVDIECPDPALWDTSVRSWRETPS